MATLTGIDAEIWGPAEWRLWCAALSLRLQRNSNTKLVSKACARIAADSKPGERRPIRKLAS